MDREPARTSSHLLLLGDLKFEIHQLFMVGDLFPQRVAVLRDDVNQDLHCVSQNGVRLLGLWILFSLSGRSNPQKMRRCIR